MIQEKEHDEYHKKEIKKKHPLNWMMISQQHLKPQGIFFLEGAIFIDLNKTSQQSYVSNANYFHQIHSSIVLRDIGILYTTFQQATKQFDSYEKIIHILKQKDNRDLQELANTFKILSLLQMTDNKVKQMIKNVVLYNVELRSIIAQKRKQYEDFRKEKISSLPKNRYFSFIDFAYDYDSLGMKITGSGMNEALIKLYGCDLESMKAISLRKGILNFMQNDSNWKLLNKLIQTDGQDPKEIVIRQTNVNIITLDEILVNTDLIVTMDPCQTGEIFEGYLHPEYQKFAYDRGVIFFEYQITDFQIRKINAIRTQFIQGLPNDFDSTYYRPYLLQQSDQQHLQQNRFSSLEQLNQDNFMEIEHTQIIQVSNPNESSLTNVLNPCSKGKIKNLINDISYLIQSQNFLEKYYSFDPSSQLSLSEEIFPNDSQNKIQKPCGFKQIKKLN